MLRGRFSSARVIATKTLFDVTLTPCLPRSDNISEYIREALSPAEIIKVEIKDKDAKVYVIEEQQSVAIGKQGQNVRLASKLTGYNIDIEVSKVAPKKKKQNVEDALLSAIAESE